MDEFETGRVAADGAFQSAALAGDVLALIDELGGGRASVIGHDWGAIAAYGAAVLAPEKIERLVTAGVPYGPGLPQALIADPAQQRRSWYMFFFLMPLAEAALRHDDFALVERLWQDWSPGWRPSSAAMAAVKGTFRRPGVAGAALDYYRHAFQAHLQKPALAELQARFGREPIRVPTLYFHGVDDGCIGPAAADGMAALFSNGLEMHLIEGAGHFLHLERPELFNEAALAFLGRGGSA